MIAMGVSDPNSLDYAAPPPRPARPFALVGIAATTVVVSMFVGR